MQKLSREVRTGIVAIVALGMLIWGFNFLKGRNIFVGRTHFYTVYDNVSGLLPNNPVLINGLIVGQVKEILFAEDNSGKVVLHLIINNTQLAIPKNTIAQLFPDGLLGAKAIKLLIGNSKDIAAAGDTLVSEVMPSLTDDLMKELLPVKTKAENLIVSLDSIAVMTRKIVDEKSKGNLRSILENLNSISVNMNTIVVEQRSRLGGIAKNIESITSNISKNNDKISNVIKNFSSISDSLAKVNIASTLNKVDRTMKETSEIMSKINKGQGSIGMLLNNDSLYKNLNSASSGLDKLLEDMREHPKRYVHFSVFGGKDKSEKKDKKKK